MIFIVSYLMDLGCDVWWTKYCDQMIYHCSDYRCDMMDFVYFEF